MDNEDRFHIARARVERKAASPSAAERLIDRRPFVSRTYVRTPGVISGGLTVWHVREWVKALDTAEIPDSALVNPHMATDTMHLIELSAYREDVRDD
jgi:hypothetical protein